MSPVKEAMARHQPVRFDVKGRATVACTCGWVSSFSTPNDHAWWVTHAAAAVHAARTTAGRAA